MAETNLTKLEQSVADELRLSTKAAEKLLPTIQRNIKVARSEMIRTGVSDVLANGSNELVEDAIITWCMYKMDEENLREKYFEEYQYQVDNIRKSKINDTEEEAKSEE